MTQQSQNNADDSSLFRIMIATDNHLGFLEDDQIRGDDSFNSFEEVLQISKAENADFLVLSGDLFHHHDPSKKTIIRTSKILEKYVYGQREHKYDVFCYEPNFKNTNLSIDLPIFTIHGNHDYPSGIENLSPLEYFAKKELNYFGRVDNVEKFDLFPILFSKNQTKISLYGIGSMKDERLYLALQNKRVNFHRPNDYQNWFNILVVHQNRFKGHNVGKNRKNYLPENFIPNFFDLVIWGHEHECFTEAVYNNEINFHVYQPGSSVATSLIQAEAKPKHIGMCEIKGKQFRIIPIRLESLRPFIYFQFELKQFHDRIKIAEDIERILDEKIEEALSEVEQGRKSDPRTMNDLLPLIRLKIEYTGYEMARTNFIVSKYSGKIANLKDVLQFWKKKSDLFSLKNNSKKMHDEMGGGDIDDNLNDEMRETDDDLRRFMEENINNYFVENNIKSVVNLDTFFEHMDREVNSIEPHAVEMLFKRFDEVSYKLSTNIDILKDIDVLKLSEKENSELFEKIVNITELNNMLKNYDNTILRYAKDNNRNGNSNSNSNSLINNEQKRLSNIERLNNYDNKKKDENNKNDISVQINQIMSKYELNNRNSTNTNNNTNNNINTNNGNNNNNNSRHYDDSLMHLVNDEMEDEESENILTKKTDQLGGKKKQYKIEPRRINKKKK